VGASRKRLHDGFFCRNAKDADVQETADGSPENKSQHIEEHFRFSFASEILFSGGIF